MQCSSLFSARGGAAAPTAPLWLRHWRECHSTGSVLWDILASRHTWTRQGRYKRRPCSIEHRSYNGTEESTRQNWLEEDGGNGYSSSSSQARTRAHSTFVPLGNYCIIPVELQLSSLSMTTNFRPTLCRYIIFMFAVGLCNARLNTPLNMTQDKIVRSAYWSYVWVRTILILLVADHVFNQFHRDSTESSKNGSQLDSQWCIRSNITWVFVVSVDTVFLFSSATWSPSCFLLRPQSEECWTVHKV